MASFDATQDHETADVTELPASFESGSPALRTQSRPVLSSRPRHEGGERSGSSAMIEAEQSTQALLADDIASVRTEQDIGLNEFVAEPLMWTLVVEMANVGSQRSTE